MSVPENAPAGSPLTRRSYALASVWLHWIIAGLILFMVFLGWRLGDHDSLRLSRVNLHKSVGILILLLSFVRIGVRLAYKAPAEPPMPKWQLIAAKALHVGFYVVMIAMPLTGWAMVSTSTRDIPFFGIFNMPHLPVPQTHDTHEVFENLHGLIAKLLIYGMIPLHVLAALKHQFVDKDEVVEHMVPGLEPRPLLNWRWIVPLGTVLLAVGLGYGLYRGTPDKSAPPPEGSSPPAMASAAAEAVSPVAADTASSTENASSSSVAAAITEWTVDKAASKIAFATTFQGEAINGSFGAYTAAIAFDPEQLNKSHVKVTIDLASVASGDKDRDSTLQGDSFFNVAATPKAVFEAKSFSKKDTTHFVAHGTLTLHGKTRAQELPFSLTIRNGVADMKGSTSLDRTNFGVGSGDYAATDTIPAAVKVDITLKAKAQPLK